MISEKIHTAYKLRVVGQSDQSTYFRRSKLRFRRSLTVERPLFWALPNSRIALQSCLTTFKTYSPKLFYSKLISKTGKNFSTGKTSIPLWKVTLYHTTSRNLARKKLLVTYQNYLPNCLKVLENYLSFFLSYIQKLPYCILTGQFFISKTSVSHSKIALYCSETDASFS